MLNCGKTISYCFSCIVVLLILRALLLYFNKSITARQKCFTFLFDDDSTVQSKYIANVQGVGMSNNGYCFS